MAPVGVGAGLGPGGSLGANGVYNYGNSKIIPLIGGSGGAGRTAFGEGSGSGAGGAILIAAANTIRVGGIVSANGGSQADPSFTFGGSGGGVRLLASQVLGNGTVRTLGSTPGRIRIEAASTDGRLQLLPSTIVVTPDSPPLIWPPANSPVARVVSVGTQSVPADPRAVLDATGADLVFTNASQSTVVIETRNLPTNSTVNVAIKPRNSVIGFPIMTTARYVSGDAILAMWQVTTNLPLGHCVIQARAVGP